MKNLSKTNKNKGITLIALVITIIVLLILAGITIATLTGDNGVITRAIEAKRESEISQIKEQIKLDILTKQNKIKNRTLTNEELNDIYRNYGELSEV